jgi:hypothetical protein
MKLKEVQISVGQTIAPRSQFEPDRINLAVTVELDDDEADLKQLKRHCRKLVTQLVHEVEHTTGTPPFRKHRSK